MHPPLPQLYYKESPAHLSIMFAAAAASAPLPDVGRRRQQQVCSSTPSLPIFGRFALTIHQHRPREQQLHTLHERQR